jgi:tetraacyldisaccharide 4'-kinase
MLTRCDQVTQEDRLQLRDAVARLAPGVPITETVHGAAELANGDQARAGLDTLQERPVAAFCGIGNPKAFRNTLLGLHANLCDFRIFPDHHAYSRTDVEDLRSWASNQPDDCMLVTTQKDMVKLRLSILGGKPLWALKVRLHVEQGKDLLDGKLLSVLNAN